MDMQKLPAFWLRNLPKKIICLLMKSKRAKTEEAKKHWMDVWHVNPSVNRDYDFIDGLRGVAILMVLVGHHFYINPQPGPFVKLLGSFIGTGGHGVTLFFALSGFLISWPFWKRKAGRVDPEVIPRGYGWRRFWKIYPPLALSIILLTPVYIFMRHDWSYLSVAAQWLAGLAFLVPVSGKLNPVMWSLAVEVQFYLVLPLVFIFLKRFSLKTCFWFITLIFLAVPVAVHIVTRCSPTFYPDINSYFPTGLDSFYVGIMIAGLENSGALQKNWAKLGDLGLLLLPVALLILSWLTRHPEHKSFWAMESVNWMVKIGAGCLLFYVANPKKLCPRLLCAPWLRWCGIISYEWYLFHQPILFWAREIFGQAQGNVLKYMAFVGSPLLVSLLISALVYRWYSLPILKSGRSRSGK
jgi:peptidoglycan/LPS O-acetylase OafA/YrhL